MKIRKIEIRKLHNEYDYTVDFDESLTFLFGPNGCGKTTVLNILASIVTGRLYNLTEYEFDEIVLFYLGAYQKTERKIIIRKNIDDKENYCVVFENEEYVIPEINSLKERLYRKAESDNIDRTFAELYPFINKIRDTFNYVYLPLNRYGMEIYDERDMYYRRNRMIFREQGNSYNNYLNDSLRYISDMIRNNCARINFEENKINDKFRKEVLTSSIQVSSEVKVAEIFNELASGDWNEILKAKKAYVKTLDDIGALDETTMVQVEKFFTDFEHDYRVYKRQGKNMSNLNINLAWRYSEFFKIKNIADLAKDNEQTKEIIRKPRELFLQVIDNFFKSSGTDKIININDEGQVYFENSKKTVGKKLRLEDLSSGEKQIVIIFASLIFGLQDNKTGIYIVDEPEASLHLGWQSEFVSSILKINKNVQLIFATHSPELIGTYRNKAVKLSRQ